MGCAVPHSWAVPHSCCRLRTALDEVNPSALQSARYEATDYTEMCSEEGQELSTLHYCAWQRGRRTVAGAALQTGLINLNFE